MRPFLALLLHLLPAPLRREHGAAIEQLMADELASARRRGRLAAAWAGGRLAADLVGRAAYEHWRRRHRYSHPEPRVSWIFPDLRNALRSLARQPAATAVVVTTLALAVAANAAVFTLLDGIFFQPLPFSHPGQLVYLNERAPKWNLEFVGVAYPHYIAWTRGTSTFQSMAAWATTEVNVAFGDDAERLRGSKITWTLPQVLQIRPIVGRFFTADEDRVDGPPVLMLSESFWRTRFGADPAVIGRTITVSGRPQTIVGVFPRNARIIEGDLWMPLDEDPNDTNESFYLNGLGRLRNGVTHERALQDLDKAHTPVWLRSDSAHVVSPRLDGLHAFLVGEYATMGKALGAGVVLVLLIACANVASVMLARSIFRRREIGIRVALGATAGRVVRQLLTESLVLAALSAVVGTALGVWGLRALLALNPSIVPQWASLDVGVRTVVFAVAIVTATAALFGLAPALQLGRVDGTRAIGASAARLTTSARDRRVLNALVITEIALAVVLLIAGGLLVRAYGSLRRTDPGFRAEGVAGFALSLPRATYRTNDAQQQLFASVIADARALPGVDHAGMVTCPPFSCHWGNHFKAEGVAPPGKDGVDPVSLTRYASPDYFAAMGIRFVRGRAFREHEGSARRGFRPVVINEEMANRFWPGGDPVGKRIASRGDTSQNWSTVVGVVKDVKHYGVGRDMIPGLYFPLTRTDSANTITYFFIAVHTVGDPVSLFPALRAIVRAHDPQLPVIGLSTESATLSRSLAGARMMALTLSLFAGIALTLAVGGIYAVLSYVVGRRRNEIGIRMALGARSGQVLRVVVVQGVALAAAGIAFGLPLAVWAAHALSAMLAGVSPTDPWTYAGVGLVIIGTAGVATVIPARRASRLDPKIALTEGAS